MRLTVIIPACVVLALFALSGCSGGRKTEPATSTPGKEPAPRKDDRQGAPSAARDPDPETRYKLKAGYALTAGVRINFTAGGQVLKVPKDASVGDLKFTEACELRPLRDKTLVAMKEGVTAKDDTGGIWESRKVTVGKKEVYAFFKKQ